MNSTPGLTPLATQGPPVTIRNEPTDTSGSDLGVESDLTSLLRTSRTYTFGESSEVPRTLGSVLPERLIIIRDLSPGEGSNRFSKEEIFPSHRGTRKPSSAHF